MPGSHGVHYPHSTIESAGSSLSGHANTLHSSASSASGINLPSYSLGSIGSSHAGALQSHIGGVSGHINTMAEREGGHGNQLVQNSANMRNTDEEHGNAFNGIHPRAPLAITNGPGGVIGGRTHVNYGNLPTPAARPPRTPAQQAEWDRTNAQNAGATRIPTNNINPDNVPENTSYPSRPQQGAPGTVPVPGETHGHTTHGEYKPPFGAGRRPRPGQAVGGHVASGDVVGPPPAGTLPPPARPPRPAIHGGGVNVGGAGGVTPAGAGSNGVYTVNNAPLSGVPAGSPGNNKPMSTMFPQGVNSGQVQNMGTQAWNHGNPSGGTHLPNAGGGGNSTWQGQAQVPYTPTWNPGHPDHGSGAGNAPNAGQNVNIQGFHRPMDPANPGVEHPATYFPQPPANQPTPAVDNSWHETGPARTYDDPNYPAE